MLDGLDGRHHIRDAVRQGDPSGVEIDFVELCAFREIVVANDIGSEIPVETILHTRPKPAMTATDIEQGASAEMSAFQGAAHHPINGCIACPEAL